MVIILDLSHPIVRCSDKAEFSSEQRCVISKWSSCSLFLTIDVCSNTDAEYYWIPLSPCLGVCLKKYTNPHVRIYVLLNVKSPSLIDQHQKICSAENKHPNACALHPSNDASTFRQAHILWQMHLRWKIFLLYLLAENLLGGIREANDTNRFSVITFLVQNLASWLLFLRKKRKRKSTQNLK